MGQNIDFDVIARDKASATFDKISKSSERSHAGLAKFAKKAAIGLGGLATGLGAVGVMGLKTAAANEQAEIAFTTMLGSAKKARSFLGELQSFAAKTPFEFPELQTAASSLISAGVNAKKVIPIMTTLGDVTSGMGTGAEGVKRATVALQQMSAAGRITGEDLNQLRDAGIPVYDLLAKATGKSKAEVVKLAQAGKLGKKELGEMMKALETGKGLERFSGLMDKQSHSLAGLASTFKDTFGQNLAKAMEPLIPLIKDGLGKASEFLAVQMPKASAAMQKFITGMRDGTGAGGKFVAVLKEAVTIGKGVLSTFAAIPGPIKKFGVEALIAVAVVKKLGATTSTLGSNMSTSAAKVKQFYAELTYAETRTQRISAASQAFGGVLRNVAGTGGMLLMADSAGRASSKLSLLESAAGGALSGAGLGAFAGPVGAGVGAAIGGLAGGALSLMRNTKSAADAAHGSIGSWKDYASTLDQVSGATTEATRAMALQKAASSGILETTRSLGLSDRMVVNGLVNGGKARDKVVAAIKGEMSAQDGLIAAKQRELDANIAIANDMSVPLARQTAAANMVKSNRLELESLKDLRSARQKDLDKVLDGVGAIRKGVEETQKSAAAVRDLTGKLKGIPPRKATLIKAEGIVPTTKGVLALAEKYKLTPKQVKTAMAATGVPFTKAQIQSVIDKAAAYAKLHPNAKFNADTSAASAKIQGLINAISRVRDKTVHITTVTNANVAEHAGTRGGGKKGGKSDRLMEDAGRTTGDAYARGVDRSRMTVKKALDKFGDLASKAADKLSSLQDMKSGFLSTFQADNLFGVDLSGGGGISALIDFEQKQADQAAQLMRDIQTVAGMGLSKSLISQLQAQGTSGAAQLHALAGGSAGQIAQFNALDAQTQASLQAAGMFAGNTVRGGNVDSDIAKAKREEALLDRLVKRLEALQDGKYLVVEIEGEEIVKAIKKRNKRKGVASAGV